MSLNRSIWILAALAIMVSFHPVVSLQAESPTTALKAPHCEVPCGIYDDQMRFEQMLEDTATIAKAIASINDFTNNMQGPPTAKGINQATRWINTKENHARKECSPHWELRQSTVFLSHTLVRKDSF